MALKGKMQAYAAARAQGLKPADAAAHADYSGSASRVTVSRIEARADVQAEIRRLRKEGGVADSQEAVSGDPDTWQMKDEYDSPLALLQDIYNNPRAPKSLRYQAAKDALPYCHARKEGGKKEADAKAAKAAGQGKFQRAQKPGQRSYVN